MKTLTVCQKNQRFTEVSYPNGVTKRQILQKAVDLLLTAAIGIGIAAVLLFLMSLA
jgi:hypothetical protein